MLFIVLSVTWLGVSNAIRDIVRERTILKWEGASGLSPRAYVASKAVALGGIAAAQAAVITFLATARQATGVRAELIGIAVLAGIAATALGLVVSSAATSADRATALLPITLVLQLVLPGEWAASAELPLLHEARFLVGTRWAMEAMAGSLQVRPEQFWSAVAALGALTTAALVAAAMLVARTVRPARPVRTTRRHLRELASKLVVTGPVRSPVAWLSGVAVLLTASAGGAGVLAVVHHGDQPASTAHVAASPQTTAPVERVITPTTVATVPVIVPVVPQVTPPAASPTAAKARPVGDVVGDVVDTAPSTPYIVAPEAPIDTPQLLPSPPTATPAAAPRPASPWASWLKLFMPSTVQGGER